MRFNLDQYIQGTFYYDSLYRSLSWEMSCWYMIPILGGINIKIAPLLTGHPPLISLTITSSPIPIMVKNCNTTSYWRRWFERRCKMDVLSATCKPIMMLITAISVGGRYKLNLKGCISIRFQPIGGYPHHIEYNNSNNKLHACTLITKKCFDFHLHFVLGEGCLYYLLNVLIRLFKPEKQWDILGTKHPPHTTGVWAFEA
jgi:hypothetical protein